MPLVVPGINSKNSGSSDWQSKLLGKTLGDSHNETSFARKDLPQNHRVIDEAKGNSFLTQDHVPERLNVHVDKDGTVKKVTQG